MSDLEEQLNSILGDPEQMSRIAEMAKTLMGGEQTASAAAEAPHSGGLVGLARSAAGGGRSNAAGLLEAMKPWLSEKRRAKLDRALKISRMAKLAEIAMAEGERRDV